MQRLICYIYICKRKILSINDIWFVYRSEGYRFRIKNIIYVFSQHSDYRSIIYQKNYCSEKIKLTEVYSRIWICNSQVIQNRYKASNPVILTCSNMYALYADMKKMNNLDKYSI